MSMRLYNSKYQKDILGKAKTSQMQDVATEWQDITQELDIALWQNLSKFQGRNNASEWTFAIKIMRNKILDLAKSTNRKKRWIDTHHSSLEELMYGGEYEEGGFDAEDPNWQKVFVQNLKEPNHPIFSE